MTQDFEAIYRRAREAFDNNQYEEAEPLLLTLLEGNPRGYADVFNKLGLICHHRGDYHQAASYFSKALSLNPKYTEASLNLAVTFNEMGEYEKASEVFSKAAGFVREGRLSLDPFVQGKLANEHGKLGDQYYDLGLYDDALEEYQKALSIRPQFVDIMTKVGMTLRAKGALDEAIRVFMRAKEVNPHYVPAFIHLGVTYYMKGFLDTAIEEWETAQKLNPESREAKVYLALARKETFDPEGKDS